MLSLIPLPIPFITDFIMLYVATVGLKQRIELYDYTAQYALAWQLFGSEMETITFPYYVYPPWLGYSFFFLGWLTPDHAARVWFWINLTILATSIVFITISWSLKWRLIAFFVMILSPAIISFLVVGQFVAPVLLGIAIAIYAASRQLASLFAIGMLLMTFKPHVGLLPFITAGGWLLLQRAPWQRRALGGVVIGIVALLVSASLIYPQWLRDYLAMIEAFRSLPTFGVCEICSAGSVMVVRIAFGYPSTSVALFVGMMFVIVTGLWLLWKTRWSPSFHLAAYWSMLRAILAIPYFNNYDHIFSLLPFLWLLKTSKQSRDYVVLGIAFLLPWIGVMLQNRLFFAVGLVGQTVVLFVLFVCRLRTQSQTEILAVW